MSKKLATCLVSGGMDSLTCLAMIIDRGHEVQILHLNYGQRTEFKELQAFEIIGDHYEIPIERRLVIDIAHLKEIGGSSLTDDSMEVTAADLDNKNIPTSYVPFRNAHILSIATSWSEVTGAELIVIGAVEEDSSGYPDCRPEYYEAFNEVIRIGTKPDTHITIITPIIAMKKAEIVKTAIALRAPLNLTWSCYKSKLMVACGVCDSCALRLRGFNEANIFDPIVYADERLREVYS